MKLVVGTRGSKLALAQTQRVVEGLKDRYEVEVKVIKTTGDVMKDKPLYEFKGIGAFVRTLDTKLAEGEIDVAVHSYKDVPSQRVEGTVIAAVLERDSPCDALISKKGESIDELPKGAVIGTSSLRRRAQLKRLRGDLEFENLRGNLDTRLRKLNEGIYDAIVVAEAGLQRLGLDREVEYQRFDPCTVVPPANQGIIAVATRKGEEDLVSFLNDEKTWLEARVERAVVRELGVGCAVPVGVYAEAGAKLKLICEILNEKYIRVEEEFSKERAVEEAVEIGRMLRKEIYGR
ncbi:MULTISPECIES: hydroxymethylbilane synthase [unclassified Archaeoglobus]|jgi:hydroxymethylbilane synthase|uniref:hydroxymethylbilane synthase n=1 Tax=unclassified Archaeoglobus TaxID=2643606 RepID=UPI0025BCD923|nr:MULTISPECIES: hydroxymethylbilane synthase [unclassified Archaeoglobus]